MPGIKALRKIQLGRESTPGTIVAATTVWRGVGAIENMIEPNYPEEDIGYLSGVDRAYIPKLGGEISLDSVEATFEQTLHLYEMGIKTATPSQDGTGSGYIYQYDFPTTAEPTLKTYTVQGGDNQQAEVMEYTVASEFTIEGNPGEAIFMSGTLMGRQVAKQAFTGSVAIPTVEDMLFGKTKLYIDAIGGSWGTTQVTNTLLGFSLNYKTGIIQKYTGDGNLYFSFLQYTPPEVKLSLTLEHNASTVTEKDNWMAGTPRLIRVRTDGSTFAQAGTTYTQKAHIIDLAGRWTKFNALGDTDGNDIYEAEFTARYNQTGAKFGKILVCTNLTTIP